MAGCPRTPSLPRCYRSLGDNIWDAECACYRRPQPIGRLVINMIRKPHFWRKPRKLLAVAENAVGDPLSDCGDSGLSEIIATGLIATKPRDQNSLMPGKAENCEEQLRDLSIARRNRMIGRLQRSVKGDPHALWNNPPKAISPAVEAREPRGLENTYALKLYPPHEDACRAMIEKQHAN